MSLQIIPVSFELELTERTIGAPPPRAKVLAIAWDDEHGLKERQQSDHFNYLVVRKDAEHPVWVSGRSVKAVEPA